MLKPYEKHNSSPEVYIDEYPVHWKCVKLREIFRERREKNKGRKNSNILSVMKNKGVVLYKDKGNVGNKHSDDIERYNIVREGDIVLNCMNVIIGSLGQSKYDGVLSPIYYVLVNKKNREFYSPYYAYFFAMDKFYKSLARYGKGILAHRMRISMEELKNIIFLQPPLEEQEQIVRYLDWKLWQIHKLIAGKKKQIMLLKEKKQEIINHVITRGLDSNTQIKDSGIGGNVKIPEDWKIVRLNKLLTGIIQGWSANATNDLLNDECWKVLTLASVKKGIFINDAVKPIGRELDIAEKIIVKKGDILLTRSNTRELVGDICVVDNPLRNTIISDLIYKLEIRKNEILPWFLSYFLLSSYGRVQIEIAAKGSSGTMPKISHKSISSLMIAIPKIIEEQKGIVDYIKNKTVRIDELIAKETKFVELLDEYRTRLIFDVVTGQVDVREVVVPDYDNEEITVEEFEIETEMEEEGEVERDE